MPDPYEHEPETLTPLNTTTSAEQRRAVCQVCETPFDYTATVVTMLGRKMLTSPPARLCGAESCAQVAAAAATAAAALEAAERLERADAAFLSGVPDDYHAAALDWIPPELAGWTPQQSVFLRGPLGCGKSGTFAALIRFHVAGVHSFEWVSTRRLVSQAQAAINRQAKRPTILANPLGPTVLVLDDLGAERPTDYAMHEVGNLIEMRYDYGAATLVSSNLTLRELADRDKVDPDTGKAEPVMGRIVDRLVGMTNPPRGLRHAWPDGTPSRRVAAARGVDR